MHHLMDDVVYDEVQRVHAEPTLSPFEEEIAYEITGVWLWDATPEQIEAYWKERLDE